MTKLSKLKWHCRRSMRELDVLLINYLEQRYKQAPIAEQQTFQALLELSDNQLQNYLLGESKPAEADKNLLDLIFKIKLQRRNKSVTYKNSN